MGRIKNFKLLDLQEQSFDCFRYQDQSFLLLIFYRGVWCNQCKRQLAEINENFQKFKRLKIKIIALSSDNRLKTSLLQTLIKAKFPLLSDRNWVIFKRFGFKKTSSKKIKPAIFLVNPNHEIIYRHIGRDTYDRPTTRRLLKNCKELV